MADGSLPEVAFRHYLVQDYFSSWSLLAPTRSQLPKLADMREAAAGRSAIVDIEMNLHVKLCAGWGLSLATPAAVVAVANNACLPALGFLR
ncbi:hypothetical protein [Bradyrhizobium sp. BR 1433]|uniref:hypothetical protein n=1 Tax=Bradyrhizobium sp. BR 1433 TaxID=3447967 RepID=UPI003EE5E156